MEKILSEPDKIIIFFCTDKYISYLTQEDGWIVYNIELKTKYIVQFNKLWVNTIRHISITNDNKYILISGVKTFILCLMDNSLTRLHNFEDYNYDEIHYETFSNFMYISEKQIFYISQYFGYVSNNHANALFSYNPETKKETLISNNWTLDNSKINYNNKTYLVADWTDGKFSFYDPNTFTENMKPLPEIHNSELYNKLLKEYNELNKNNQRYKYYKEEKYNDCNIFEILYHDIGIDELVNLKLNTLRKYNYINYFNGDITYRKIIVDTQDSFQLDYETNTIYSTHDNAIYKFDINNYLTEFYTLLNDYHIPPEIQNIILKYI